MYNRAKAKVKTNAYEKHNENVENLLCIGVDGRTKTHDTTRNQWRKMEVKFRKKAKDLNAT